MIRQGEDMRGADFESRREAADFAEFGKRVGHAAGISGWGARLRDCSSRLLSGCGPPVVGGACRIRLRHSVPPTQDDVALSKVGPWPAGSRRT